MESDVRPPKRSGLTEEEYENYDVFLSHRGPDTKTGFVGFLYEALERAGLRPFLDRESIDKGQDSWTCIEHAIENTPLALVIFSESFAQSEWCVKELHVMLHTPGVKVLPVFYRVKPWEVSLPEKGQLAAGFEKLKGRHDEILIEQWREDLRRASMLDGWEQKVTDDRLERELVKEIVGKVLDLANKPLSLDVGEHVVGVDRVAEEIIRELNERRTIWVLGLWGMGGIGKSTLARELYNRLRRRFESACYVEDVTEKVVQGGVVKVQNHILEDLCKNEATEVKDKSKGKSILEERLCRKRILLVLDDVRESEEMGYWISRKIVTEGSMCIVTSRNRRVFEESVSFDVSGEVYIHDVRGLSMVDSRRVFASHAFGGLWKVKPVFGGLVESVSSACGGVPLVLKVCGRLLKGEEDVRIWDEVVRKLSCGGIMDERRIFECLRISYDALSEHDQEMFLDVACGLVGEAVDCCVSAWKSLGWSAALGVRGLEEKALITVDGKGRFGMHDHLRDMGREIVRKRRASDGVCRRLWMPESLSLLTENGRLPDSLQTLSIFSKSDSNVLDLDVSYMRDLRILICDGAGTRVMSSLPKHLRWLSWSRESWGSISWTIATRTFPAAVENNELVMLDLKGSLLGDLAEAFGEFRKLEVLNLSRSDRLTLLPDSFGGLKSLRDLSLRGCGIKCLPESFGKLSNLEVLHLELCEELISLPNSFWGLEKLRELWLGYSGIRQLPELFGKLNNLDVLNLGACSGLHSLPNSFGDLEKLRDMKLARSGIRQLPESFGKLSNLELLNLRTCRELCFLPNSFGDLKKLRELFLEDSGIRQLPESFGKLSNLEALNLRSCCGLSSLPHSFGNLEKLRKMKLEDSGIRELPESFGKLSNLDVLKLGAYSKLSYLPNSFGDLKKLRELNLEHSGIRQLPESFGKLNNLEVLNLEACTYLSSLPSSFGDLEKLRNMKLADSGIRQLPESFEELSNLPAVLGVKMWDVYKNLSVLPSSLGFFRNQTALDLAYFKMETLPESFGDLVFLKALDLRYCENLISLPGSFGKLSNLEVLDLGSGRDLISLPESFTRLANLRTLRLDCSGIERLPESFGDLSSLERLNITQCGKLVSLPSSFGRLSSLVELYLRGCEKLTMLPDWFGSLRNLRKLTWGGKTMENLPACFGDLEQLQELGLDCGGRCAQPQSFTQLRNLQNLQVLRIEGSGTESLPESFGELYFLKVLNVRNCRRLIFLPSSFGKLMNLAELDLSSCCDLISLPNSFGDLSSLKRLDMAGCPNLVSLPWSFGSLSSLEKLNLRGCEKLRMLPGSFGDLRHLQVLDLQECWELRGLPQSFTQLWNLEMLILHHCPASSSFSSIQQLMPVGCKVTL